MLRDLNRDSRNLGPRFFYQQSNFLATKPRESRCFSRNPNHMILPFFVPRLVPLLVGPFLPAAQSDAEAEGQLPSNLERAVGPEQASE